MRLKRLLRFGLIISILLILLLVRGCVLRPGGSAALSTFNRGSNATWLGIEWVNEPHTEAEISKLASDFQQKQIRTVFVYASYMRPDGTFKNTYAQSAPFLKTLKAAYPAVQVLAWIGIPLNTLSGGHADLGNAATRASIVRFCEELTKQSGFDGVHLDPEIVHNDDADFLRLLVEVRAVLDKKSVLSIASQAIFPIFSESILANAGGFAFWSQSYYQEVAGLVDQIAVMSYDSTLSASWLYVQWMRFQVINLTKALRDWNGELFIGIPASEERTGTHNPNVENIDTALGGILLGLNDAESIPGKILGVSIYPWWETDLTEFSNYEKRWLGK